MTVLSQSYLQGFGGIAPAILPFASKYQSEIISILATGVVVPLFSYFFWWLSIWRPRRRLLQDLLRDAQLGLDRYQELLNEESNDHKLHRLQRYIAMLEVSEGRLTINQSMFGVRTLDLSQVVTSFRVVMKAALLYVTEINDRSFWDQPSGGVGKSSSDVTYREWFLIPYIRLEPFLRRYRSTRDLRSRLQSVLGGDEKRLSEIRNATYR